MMQAQAPQYGNGTGHQLQSSPHSAHPQLPAAPAHPHPHPQSHPQSHPQPHPQSQAHAPPELAYSDDGGPQSADDYENDEDQLELARPGKRKRPISVS